MGDASCIEIDSFCLLYPLSSYKCGYAKTDYTENLTFGYH